MNDEPQTDETREITHQVKRLCTNVNSLDQALKRLSKTLEPLINASNPQDEDNTAKPAVTLCPLASDLCSNNDSMEAMLRGLGALINAIEIN
jgi:hypothetical protein